MSNAEKLTEEKMVTLDSQEITTDQFNEKLDNLASGERIVEVSTDHYETVTRMRG